MYRQGYSNAAIRFGYIPDFNTDQERVDFEAGMKAGYVRRDEVEGIPSGLSVKKVKGGYEVIHTKSGNSLFPFAYPEKELATDFARRAGQVGVDWTRPFSALQKESEKIADLIRGGEKPGMFEKVLDMPTTFPADDELIKLFGKNMDKDEIIEAIMTFTDLKKGSDEYNKNAKALSLLHRYELRDSLVDLQKKKSPVAVASLQSIHDARSPRSRESDERLSNADTIEPDDPRVEQWVRDPGRVDVVGIDTPRKGKSKKVGRKVRKDSGRRVGKTETQLRGLRG